MNKVIQVLLFQLWSGHAVGHATVLDVGPRTFLKLRNRSI